MKFISTRGHSSADSFEEVLLTGLAPDGGLYIPQSLPAVDADTLAEWKKLSYSELAFEIIRLFVDQEIPDAELKTIVDDTYARFSDPNVAPLKRLDKNEYVLELYFGPTLAFKDFALQLLGRLLDYFLQKRKQHVVILGATSGDTGSAALEGCRDSEFVDMYILHPHNRVSEVQRRQMTSVIGDHINNIAIEGNFDNCQQIVKQAFADQSFLPDGYQLVAVNSINFARIMAQIVYYFSSGLALLDQTGAISFSVPTGNFGDIYAGYLAKKMGLPVDRLIIATNKNDILHRFISGNQYNLGSLEPSLSPSMDIMVSSNFERFLYDLFAGDTDKVTQFVTGLGENAQHVSDEEWSMARSIFDSYRVDDDLTCQTIREVFDQYQFLIDPHTATGVRAAQECVDLNAPDCNPVICLATAHPAKFSEAIERAGLETPELPVHLKNLFDREERFTVLENDLDTVKQYIAETL